MARDRSGIIADEHKRSSGGPVQKYNVVDLKKLERLGINFYKIVVGDNYVRYLPPDDAEVMFGRRIYVHYEIGPNNMNVLCPRCTHNADNEEIGKPCMICDLATKFWNMGDDANKERAKALFCVERWLFWVVDTTDDKSCEKGVQLFDSPKKIKEELTGLCIGRRGAKNIDPSDPEHGRDLLFNRQGKGKTGTSYSSFKLLDPEPIPEEWYQDLPKFDDVLHWVSEDLIAEMVDGIEASPPKEKKEETPKTDGGLPPRNSRRNRRSSTPVQEEAPSTVNEDSEVDDDIPFEDNNQKQKEEPENQNPQNDTQESSSGNEDIQSKINTFKRNRRRS